MLKLMWNGQLVTDTQLFPDLPNLPRDRPGLVFGSRTICVKLAVRVSLFVRSQQAICAAALKPSLAWVLFVFALCPVTCSIQACLSSSSNSVNAIYAVHNAASYALGSLSKHDGTHTPQHNCFDEVA